MTAMPHEPESSPPSTAELTTRFGGRALFAAVALALLAVPFALTLLLMEDKWVPRLALFVVITGVGSSLLNTVVKSSVHRLRPVLTDPVAREPGLSFPSGHARAAIVGYGVLLLVFLPILHGVWRTVAVATAVFMVLAIGFSSIALGVHYLSDVIGGFILGAAWVAARAAAFNAMRVDRGRRAASPGEGLEPDLR
jgi:membrane-associated phospholipid phosphatase